MIQRAGMATHEEASQHIDLHRIPRHDEPALLEAYRLDIHSRMTDRVDIIASKERVGDDCELDYTILSSLCFVRMLLKPMRSQIQDCRNTLNKAEDDLHKLLAHKRDLAAKEARQRQVIAYYRQLLSELEQLRGEDEHLADGEGTEGQTMQHRPGAAPPCSPAGSTVAVPPTPGTKTPLLGYRTPRRPPSGRVTCASPQRSRGAAQHPERATAMAVDQQHRPEATTDASNLRPKHGPFLASSGVVQPSHGRSASFGRPTEALMSAQAPLPVGLVSNAAVAPASHAAAAHQPTLGLPAAPAPPGRAAPPPPATVQSESARSGAAGASAWLADQAHLAAMQHFAAERAATSSHTASLHFQGVAQAAPLQAAAGQPGLPQPDSMSAQAQADLIARATKEAEREKMARHAAERDATLAAEFEHAAAEAISMRRQGELEMAALAEADCQARAAAQRSTQDVSCWGRPHREQRAFSPYPPAREALHRRRDTVPLPTALPTAAAAPYGETAGVQPARPPVAVREEVAGHVRPVVGTVQSQASPPVATAAHVQPSSPPTTHVPGGDEAAAELAKLDATPLTAEEYEQCMRDVFLQEEAEIAEQNADFAKRVHFADRQLTLEEQNADEEIRYGEAFGGVWPAPEPLPPGRFTPATGDYYESWYASRAAAAAPDSSSRSTGGQSGSWSSAVTRGNAIESGSAPQAELKGEVLLEDCWTDDAEWAAPGPDGATHRESPVRVSNLAPTFDAAAQDAPSPAPTMVPTSQLTPSIMRRHIGGADSPPHGEAEIDAYEHEYMNAGSVGAAKAHLDAVLLQHQREVAAQLAGGSDTDDVLSEPPNAQRDGRETLSPSPSPPPAAFQLGALIDLSSQHPPDSFRAAETTGTEQPPEPGQGQTDAEPHGTPPEPTDSPSSASPPPPPPLSPPSQSITPTLPYEPQQSTASERSVAADP